MANQSKPSFVLIAAVLVLLCCLLTTAGGTLWFLPNLTAQPPVVLINTPAHNARVQVGQEVAIQSVARAEQKVKRVELWVDGSLFDTQTSDVPNGISPFPLTTHWQPRTPGLHTIIVRAFNNAGKRGFASVNINATTVADRDNDGVPDETDLCPDQPGLEIANGCPDRDRDGIRDNDDACPDQAGMPDARGCPAPSMQDRDGDGVLDSADTCPDQPGSPWTSGCPDADGDMVRDADDACPREPGLPSNRGCPVPNDRDGDGVTDASDACPDQPGTLGGCPDSDSDGVRDRDDACPDLAGAPGTSGCPDRDGDGVRDTLDLCPNTPGPRDNAGCPRTSGDRDSDGVDDDHDLAPGESGSADSGGAPPPGGSGEAVPSDPLDDFAGSAIPGERLVGVTFEALEFEVNGDYNEVYCYTSLGGAFGVVERVGPFDALGARRWDIAEYLGGANSRFVTLPPDTPLQGYAECHAYTEYVIPGEGVEGTYWNLGSVRVNHPASDWDGHVITQNSTGGSSGRSFQVKYRVCSGSCRNTDFPAPMLHLYSIGGRHQLVWLWSGNRADIDGFRVYVNGHRAYDLRTSLSSHYLASAWEPMCGERRTFQLTAFRGDRESPLSNLTYWSGQPCPRRVKVTFEEFSVSSRLSTVGGDMAGIGPIYGRFWAMGNGESSLPFDAGECWSFLWIFSCRGYDVFWQQYNITELFGALRTRQASCLGRGCPEMYAPAVNYVIVEVGGNEDLVLGARIMDEEAYGHDETLFDTQQTVRADTPLPVDLRIEDRYITLRVRVEAVSGP